VARLKSQLGERVLGTSFNMGTEIMTIADLNEMEARVDIGETDVVLISPGQNARLEVDAFKDRKFTGTVTEIANSAKGSASGMSSSQDATRFEVRIRVAEKELFRPGMSVTAEIETRYRTNVIAVPFASVTGRTPKEKKGPAGNPAKTNTAPSTASTSTNAPGTNAAPVAIAKSSSTETNSPKSDRKNKEKEKPKQIEVVFVLDGDHVKMVPVKIGIFDEDYYEIVEGLDEDKEVVSGGYRAISHDLEDGKRVVRGMTGSGAKKEL